MHALDTGTHSCKPCHLRMPENHSVRIYLQQLLLQECHKLPSPLPTIQGVRSHVSQPTHCKAQGLYLAPTAMQGARDTPPAAHRCGGSGSGQALQHCPQPAQNAALGATTWQRPAPASAHTIQASLGAPHHAPPQWHSHGRAAQGRHTGGRRSRHALSRHSSSTRQTASAGCNDP